MDCGKRNAGIAGPAAGGTGYPYPPARKSFYNHHLSIIHPQSSFINRKGFTLIELLVVIAVIAMLMAILMPTLSGVRKQARAVACQANLRQWGTLHAAYTGENDGYLASLVQDRPIHVTDPWYAAWRWGAAGLGNISDRGFGEPNSPWLTNSRGIMFCPRTTNKWTDPTKPDGTVGGTFRAWCAGRMVAGWSGSYGMQEWAHSPPDPSLADRLYYWMTSAVKSANTVPVFLDSAVSWIQVTNDTDPPPICDAIPVLTWVPSAFSEVCMNRHDGGINCLFLDWSVRKVGLKELWTLKWNPQYNTVGPWTKRGGAKPEDWPAWMRGFKDY